MKKALGCLLFTVLVIGLAQAQKRAEHDSVIRMEIWLSAFGVESDDYPNIKGVIDFTTDTGYCARSYFNPAVKPTVYQFSVREIHAVKYWLEKADLPMLKPEYTAQMMDLGTSTLVIYTAKRSYIIKDYGLVGEYPLQEIYKIVYRL